MPSFNKATPLRNQPLSLLLIGPPGGGKTTLMLQFPLPGVIDVDMNMQGPVSRLAKLNPDFAFEYDTVPLDDKGAQVPLHLQLDRLHLILDAMIASPKVKTVGLDGLTAINHIAINHVLFKSGKAEMERSLWIPFRQEIMRIITKLKNCGKTSILLCHEEFKTKEDKGVETIIKRSPAMDSKIKDYFAGFFTDMYRCQQLPAPGNTSKFILTTRPSGVDELKTSCGMPAEVDVTKLGYQALLPYLQPLYGRYL